MFLQAECPSWPNSIKQNYFYTALYDYQYQYNTIVVVVVTRSDQPKPPAVAIVRQNGLSSASCRASVAVTPMSRQIWWIQVVGGRPLAHLHSCEGRSPPLVLVQI